MDSEVLLFFEKHAGALPVFEKFKNQVKEAMEGVCMKVQCTSQQKLDTNFKYYLSINLISVQYGASFATFLSG